MWRNQTCQPLNNNSWKEILVAPFSLHWMLNKEGVELMVSCTDLQSKLTHSRLLGADTNML